MISHDISLNKSDIQSLSSQGAVRAFFTRLGYSTELAATEAAPAILEGIQSAVVAVLRAALNSPHIDRGRLRQALS